jgi:hypothetical protein
LTAFLSVQSNTTSAAADVQDSAAHKAHGAAMMRRPATKGGEIEGGSEDTRVDEAVVALDDLDGVVAGKPSQEHLPIGIRAFAPRRRHGRSLEQRLG